MKPMKTTTILTLVIAGLILTSANSQARAKRLSIGKKERLHELCDAKLCGPHGEKLAVSFKTTTTQIAGLGLYCKNDGYVLSLKDAPGSFFNWPDATQVGQFQFIGLLPQPLPSYKVPAREYISGSSLWLLAMFAAVCLTIKNGVAHAKLHPQAAVGRERERETTLIPAEVSS
jgi:hypothetical protein